MSSEQLADGVNPLDAELAATWDILKGYSGRDTDLGIARRFGGAAAAYSLRDIGAMNGRVVKVRRDSGETTDPEEDFSDNQVASSALEDWVNGKLENTLPADVATAAAAYSLRKVKADYSSNAVRIRRSSDDAEVNVAFDSDNKVSTSSSISVVSGTVTDTTFGDFISGTDAFVHTWYDQAGSNNAVQATAGNQPKIASSGTLLSSLDYSDGGKFLQLSSTVSVGEDVSLFGVATKSTGTDVLFDARSSSGNGFRLFEQSNVQKFNYDATTVSSTFNPSAGNNFLITAIQDGSNAKIGVNANTFDTASETTVESITPTPVIGGKSFTTVGADNWEGTISEIIYYTSDQTDNRFKIESNINNYYGLYNDENEVTGAFIAVEGSGNSFTPNGTDGFILDIVTSTGYAGIQLNEKVTSGDNIFISFNADINRKSTPASFNLALRKTSVNGSISSSQQFTPTQGFNSYTLTSSDSDAEYIAFGEGSDNVGIEVTDFKVSRIARNGFVETWYDQSANQRDAIQETATNQPSIVQNGGIVKVNSKPAITFDGNDNFLEVDGTGSAVAYSFSPSGDFGMFIVYKASVGNITDSRDAGSDGIFLQQSSGTDTRFRYNGDGSINIVATNDEQHFNTMTLDGTTLSASVDGGTAGTDTVTAGVSTTQNLVLGAGFNQANATDGEIQEAIFYENNKTTDKANIEADIDNFYSIT